MERILLIGCFLNIIVLLISLSKSLVVYVMNIMILIIVIIVEKGSILVGGFFLYIS